MIKLIGKALLELNSEGKVNAEHYSNENKHIYPEDIVYYIIQVLHGLKRNYEVRGYVIKLIE